MIQTTLDKNSEAQQNKRENTCIKKQGVLTQGEVNPGRNPAKDDKVSFIREANPSLYPLLNITLLGIITIDYYVIYMYHTVL